MPTYVWSPTQAAALAAGHDVPEEVPQWGPFDTPDQAHADALYAGWEPDEYEVYEA